MKNLCPVEVYTPPVLPTLTEKPSLCPLPKRWLRNAAVVACIGVLGAASLTGCMGVRDYPSDVTAPYVRTQETAPAANYSELDFEVRMNHGGTGVAWYVVHLTEQEMQGIILAQLEDAGLSFGANPPSYAVNDDEENRWRPRIGLDLFDEQRNTAAAFIGWEENNRHFVSWGGDRLARETAERFAELTDMPIGVFYNPDKRMNSRWVDDERVTPTREEAAMHVPALVANLNAQTQAFVELLQREGIL
ncbi:MAG: hypothetical protein FWD06_00655 [Oscillospiraceae bacterium]|nr:hypothetical protein [Oscillospiraceae bacterium]